MTKRKAPTASAKPEIDRDRLYASFRGVHPGIEMNQRLDMMFSEFLEALCDEIEGK